MLLMEEEAIDTRMALRFRPRQTDAKFKSHRCLFFLFPHFIPRALQEVDRTDEESADHHPLRVLQGSEVHRRHQ